MKTRYDDEIEELEKEKETIDTRIDSIQKGKNAAYKTVIVPYDEKLDKFRREKWGIVEKIFRLKHNREIYIRNQELQKNKDLFSKGMSFKDLILTGDGRFSEYQYFLKSGTEVIPKLDISVEGINSEDELRAKAKELLSEDEMEHLSRAYWGRYLEFALDVPVKAIRKLYQAGFKFKGFGSEESVDFRETDETMKRRRANPGRTSRFPLSYTRELETVTVIKKEAGNEG